MDPISSPPPLTEMTDRLTRLRARMVDGGLDFYVAHDPHNVFYLTNFANYVHERPFVLVIARDGPMRFVVPKLEIPHVRMRAIGEMELIEYFEFPAPKGQAWDDVFALLFPADARVGVESICPLQIYDAIPAQRVRSDCVEQIREIKSEYEIARLAYGGGLAVEGAEILLAEATPDQSLIAVNTRIKSHMMFRVLLDEPGTNALCTDMGVVFQPPSISHDPHNFTDVNMVMAPGGPHVFLINGTMNGYGTELERTFFLGHVPQAARRPYDTMMAARALAFDLLKPGASMGAVDKEVNDMLRQAGYGENLLHRTGHSIGVTGHEGPFLAEGYEHEVRPGMIFTIEPGIYLPGVGGFRHSDTVLVTEHGNQSLTPFPDDLAAMTLPIKT